MTGVLEIMDALAKSLCEGLPKLNAIYTDLAPVDFERPSALIQSVTNEYRQASSKTVEITSYFTITLFDNTDDYANSSTKRLLEMQQDTMDLFRSGYLTVGARSLPVQASTGGRDWDKAYVDLQFSYHDLRDETPDTTPKMGSVETNMNLKG